jgi:hypothetical protein
MEVNGNGVAPLTVGNTVTLPHHDWNWPTTSADPVNIINKGSNNMEMSDNINEIAAALSKAQGELHAAKKDTKGFGYTYSDLASVISAAREPLSKNGLAITQLLGAIGEGIVTVTTILSHSSGQFFKSVSTLPIVEMKSNNSAQEAGASVSYLRRYAYQSILGMASEDNDASSQKAPTSAKAAAKKAPVKANPKTSFRRKKVDTKGDEDDI